MLNNYSKAVTKTGVKNVCILTVSRQKRQKRSYLNLYTSHPIQTMMIDLVVMIQRQECVPVAAHDVGADRDSEEDLCEGGVEL